MTQMRNEIEVLDVLAIGAHPDDVELSAGGTLIRMARLGYKTGILDSTRGEAGTRGNPEIRAEEAKQAAEILGLTIRENLGLPDAHIQLNEESRTAMVRMIRKLHPKIILTHHMDDPHPDHANVSRIVREAAHLSGLTKFDSDFGLERFRPNCVAHFLFPRTVAPTFIIDISDSYKQKWDAIGAHKSQFFNQNNKEDKGPVTRVSTQGFLKEMEARDRYFGAMINVDYGEPFYVREALNVDDPVALLTRSMNMYS